MDSTERTLFFMKNGTNCPRRAPAAVNARAKALLNSSTARKLRLSSSQQTAGLSGKRAAAALKYCWTSEIIGVVRLTAIYRIYRDKSSSLLSSLRRALT